MMNRMAGGGRALAALWMVCAGLPGGALGQTAKTDKPPAPAAALQLKLQLPDGEIWILGAGGVGRPFMARLLLINAGTQPLTLWDPFNSEGSTCPAVVLTSTAGQETVLRPPAMARLAGVPSFWDLKPSEVREIPLELLRLVGERSLPSGDYRIRAVYENTLPNDSIFGAGKSVWIGRIESDALAIRIEAPKL